MPKSSQQQAAENEANVFEAIVTIFMENGWEAVTYAEIAKRTGMTRGGIQRIVPNKDAMINAFRGQIFAYVMAQLDTTSEKAILDSWQRALEDHKFANCIRYLVTATTAKEEGRKRAAMGVQRLSDIFGETLTQRLIGMSVIHLLSH